MVQSPLAAGQGQEWVPPKMQTSGAPLNCADVGLIHTDIGSKQVFDSIGHHNGEAPVDAWRGGVELVAKERLHRLQVNVSACQTRLNE